VLTREADQERGRRAEVARVIGIKRQSITDWFSGQQQPTAEQILEVQEFLAKQKAKRAR
jgi:transcriptional regulator with XRE-family HTH domain